jgi:hypothetical protein
MMMAGVSAPHFLFSPLVEKKENGPCTVQKKKETPGRNLTARVKFAQDTGAGLNRCQCELPAFYRLRLTEFRPLALCRSCDCHRGCFAGLTQGLSRRFPHFAPGWVFAGWDAVLPAELWGQQPSAGHPLTVLQVAAQSPKSWPFRQIAERPAFSCLRFFLFTSQNVVLFCCEKRDP